MNRRRLVHRNDAEGLQSLGALQHLDRHPRTFVGRLVAVAAQARHVQKYVGHPVVGNDESKTLGDIEPLDDAGQFDEIGRRLVDESLTAPGRRFAPDIFNSTPSDAMTPRAATLLAPLDGRFDESLRNRR